MKKQEFTIMIYTENAIGLLNRVSNLFTRRQVNIMSLTASESSISGIAKWTILVKETEEQVQFLSKKIETLVNVLKVFYKTNDEISYREIALFKIPVGILTRDNQVEKLIDKYNGKILKIAPKFAILCSTGKEERNDAFNKELRELGDVLQFVRSGRIAVTLTEIEELAQYLKSLDTNR